MIDFDHANPGVSFILMIGSPARNRDSQVAPSSSPIINRRGESARLLYRVKKVERMEKRGPVRSPCRAPR
jgi:hypothetical protein